jgi:hypothetical protein
MRRHNLYTRYQVGIIRPIEDVMGSACSSHGGDGNAYKILIGKPEGKRPRRRLRRGWDDIIEMDLGLESVDLIYLALDRDDWQAFVNSPMNLRFP